MRRLFASIAIAACVLTVVGAGIALAADLEVVSTPSDDGLTELTIDVVDFDANIPIYVLPCDVPEPGMEVDVASDACDIAAVTVGTTDDDGRATIVVTWAIPDEGIAVYVGDEHGANQITQVVGPTVVVEGAAPPAVENPDVEVLGTNLVQDDPAQDDLAETGPREILLGLLLVGTALIAVGSVFTGLSRTHTLATTRV